MSGTKNLILREILSVPFFLLAIVVASRYFWVAPLMYVLARTLQAAPNGAIIRTYIFSIGAAGMWGGISFFLCAIRRTKRLKALKQAGEVEEFDVVSSQRLNIWRFGLALVAANLIIPAGIVLQLWNGPIQEYGHRTQRQNLREFLNTMERRGIFTPFKDQ